MIQRCQREQAPLFGEPSLTSVRLGGGERGRGARARGEGRGGLVLHLQLLSTGIEGSYEVLAGGAQARWRRRYRGMLGRG
jgi:hypothetical protein